MFGLKAAINGKCRIVAFGVMMACGAVVAGAVPNGVQAETVNGSTIQVSGQGRVNVAPDMAYIQVGVTHEAELANDALAGMSHAIASVLDQLDAVGIAKSDIQTGQVQLHPQYSNSSLSGREQSGFVATTMLNVQVLDLADLGHVLDAVVAQGANRLGGLRFDVQDRAPHLDHARLAAVEDAQSKAAFFANAAGVEIGDVIHLIEDGVASPSGRAIRMAMESAVPIAEGEIEISAGVVMVLAID
ncbi:SIMPL domain-containing protein [Aestuariibius sp. HNIBRBA575]|uniref:SIMPL domain-containing protein n=1 Tax=Aestuariibius sp. HNIBRBA575 TaxID=3233343 RepID=UPI0034A570FD